MDNDPYRSKEQLAFLDGVQRVEMMGLYTVTLLLVQLPWCYTMVPAYKGSTSHSGDRQHSPWVKTTEHHFSFRYYPQTLFSVLLLQ